jgi:hypothetical protein
MTVVKNQPRRTDETLPDIHVDDKFLQDHLRDVRSEMSWRRELEFRLMQFLLVFYPIIGTVMVSLFQSKVSVQAFYITAVGAGLLILAASIFVNDRINREHEAYADLGREVQKIWAYFGLFEAGAYIENETVVPSRLYDKEKGYGQGQGHKKTLGLVWLITVALISVVLTLALLKT